MKYLIVSLMFFVSIGSHAQFIDPVLSGTVAAGDAAKKKSLDGIKDKQNKIAALQTTIAANTAQIRKYEKDMYNYLSNVSAAIKNAYEIKEAASLTAEIVKCCGACLEAAKKNPQGIAVVALVNKQIAKVSADMASIYAYITTLALDKKTLLNAAERNRITWTVLYELRKLKNSILLLCFQIENYTIADVPQLMFPTEYFYIVDGKRIAQEIIRDFSK